ncbi:MAG TPA: DinB family protein [Thermoanaerobaculia bacterium]|nr:DinB family protein [Thermoanaerobaculia bacterium]
MADLLHAIRGLLAYTIWADRQLLVAAAEISAEDLARDTGTSHRSVLGTLAHVLGAEQLWLSRFLGVPLTRVPNLEDFPNLDVLRASWEDFWPQLEFFLASLTSEQVAGDFTWTNTEGATHTAPFQQVLLHFVNHATYHRGQVAAQMRQLGHAPPSTDLVYWRGAF